MQLLTNVFYGSGPEVDLLSPFSFLLPCPFEALAR